MPAQSGIAVKSVFKNPSLASHYLYILQQSVLRRYRPDVGRYMVATRDIQPMELILTDLPAVVGSDMASAYLDFFT